ncbi:HNH endonuclease [Bacillus thuringiensis]|uniref:HNH endonuclease n=1 Tax=Bacillus thuringiensis TaxID=1428 RepID=A0A4V2WE61_BACTU|nr:NUMOD4 domain-containing protein [Bacillus thuringiensis]TCW59060.1 HNH endonuclease [Bacillus thuringiensis]TCW59700.1 HNH endonuclease [Bacillus thuringiensis]
MKNTQHSEEWRDVKGYEGYYKISNKGRVLSLDRPIVRCGRKQIIKERILKTHIQVQNHYAYAVFTIDTISKKFSIHRLVAEAFIENPDNKPFVNHKNGVRDDNDVRNLEWVTQAENVKHAFETGLNTCNKKVAQYSLDNILLDTFESVREASRSLGRGVNVASSISACCNGKRKTAYGYKWKHIS